MKKLLFLAGVLLALSFVFPDGIPLNAGKPVVVVPPDNGEKSADIVRILSAASPADRTRIYDVYSGAKTILQRDGGKRLNTTEKWAEWHANTLQLAIDTPGKYPGLDVAIENVFRAKVGTDDVTAMTPEVVQRLITACEVVAASAK